MTQTETDEASMRTGLERVVELIELASNSVAKLMASVSCSTRSMTLAEALTSTGLGTKVFERPEIPANYSRPRR